VTLILTRLKAKDRWLKRAEVMSDLGVKTQSASDALALLVNDGKIGTKLNGGSTVYHWDPKRDPKA
jgi:predicted transcriptional regulator